MRFQRKYRKCSTSNTPQYGIALALAQTQFSVEQGKSISVPVVLTRLNGFNGAVQLVVGGLPTGVTAPSVVIGAGNTAGVLVFNVGSAAVVGQDLLKVTASDISGGYPTATPAEVGVTLEVTAPVVVTPPPPPPAPVVASVTVTLASGALSVGEITSASAVAKDASGVVITGRAVTWTSSDTSVATVSPAGLVTAVGAGSATITATVDGISGSAALTATVPIPTPVVTSVVVSLSATSLLIGQTATAVATPRDASGNPMTGQTITWSSSDSSVATVSSGGLVTAIAAGPVSIIATVAGISGSAALSVAAPTVPPPPPTPVPGAITFKTYRNDDFASATQRAIGPVYLPPNLVTPADVAKATVWTIDGLTQVPAYVADVGARHMGVAPNSVRYLEVEVEPTFASLADEPRFQLRFDKPLTTTPLTRQGATLYSNPLDLGFSTDGKKWRLNQAVTYFHGDEDIPRRALPQDIIWTSTPTINGGTTGVNQKFVIAVGTDGVARAFVNGAYPGSSALNGGFSDTLFWYPWYLPNTGPATRYQPIIAANIFVPAGQTVVIGTDVLSGNPNVTYTGGTKVPASLMLDGVPRACLAPDDPAYYCSTQFPGYELPTAAEIRALGAGYAAVIDKHLDGSNIYWYLGGPQSWQDSGGATAYNYPRTEQVLYAMTGQTRYMRRALGYGRAVFLNMQANNFTPQEQQNDCSSILSWAQLMNDRSAAVIAGASKAVWWGERTQLAHGTGNTGISSQSGRWGLHALLGLNEAELCGIQLDDATQVPGATAAFTLTIPYDDGGWPNASSWKTVKGNKQRVLRLFERYATYLKPEPTQAANAGLLFLNLEDYDFGSVPNYGDGVFMAGHIGTAIVLCTRTFGVIPQAARDVVEKSAEFHWSGVSHYNGAPFLPPGADAFVYATPGGYLRNGNSRAASPTGSSATGANLNGFHLAICWWLLQLTQDPKWRFRGDAFYQRMQISDIRFNHKEGSELGLYGHGWPKESRKAVVPGYTGVLTSATLSSNAATLLSRVGGPNDTTTLSVTQLLDRFGDPVSVVGATVTWSSSAPSVATVSSGGLVTAVGAGNAVITATIVKGGITITATAAITVRAVVLEDTFSGSGAPGSAWTKSVSGLLASQTVTGGALVQTTQNVSYAQITQATPYNIAGGRAELYLAGFSASISCQQDFVVCDAAGIGVVCRIVGNNLLAYICSNGNSSPVTTGTTLNGGVSLVGATTMAWRVSCDATTNKITIESSTNGGSTWVARATAVTVPGFDPSTARIRFYSYVGAGGVGPFTTSVDLARAY